MPVDEGDRREPPPQGIDIFGVGVGALLAVGMRVRAVRPRSRIVPRSGAAGSSGPP
jgi:hypothetical protein